MRLLAAACANRWDLLQPLLLLWVLLLMMR
jgi:hypothetical protein